MVTRKHCHWRGEVWCIAKGPGSPQADRNDAPGTSSTGSTWLPSLEEIRSLVAELFDGELEQAKELLASGQKAAAAVVAGVVLKTALRGLYGDRGIPVGKLDKISADLANAGVYDKLMHKRVTTLAEIQNKAAHGDTAGFNDADVRGMITDVERFVSDYLAACELDPIRGTKGR